MPAPVQGSPLVNTGQVAALGSQFFSLRLQEAVELATLEKTDEQRAVALRTDFERNLGRRIDLIA